MGVAAIDMIIVLQVESGNPGQITSMKVLLEANESVRGNSENFEKFLEVVSSSNQNEHIVRLTRNSYGEYPSIVVARFVISKVEKSTEG